MAEHQLAILGDARERMGLGAHIIFQTLERIMKNFGRSVGVLSKFTGDYPLWEKGKFSKDLPIEELTRLLLEINSHIGDCRRARKELLKELNRRID